MVTRRQPTTRRKQPAKPTPVAEPKATPWTYWERLLAIGARVPAAEWAKGPHDSARYCDEYLEGAREEH